MDRPAAGRRPRCARVRRESSHSLRCREELRGWVEFDARGNRRLEALEADATWNCLLDSPVDRPGGIRYYDPALDFDRPEK